MKNNKLTLGILVSSAIIGGLVGLAFAPDKGINTRKKAKKKVNKTVKKWIEEIEATLPSNRSTLASELIDVAQDADNTVISKAAEVEKFANEKLKQAKKALDNA